MNRAEINITYIRNNNPVEIEQYSAIGQLLSKLETSRFRVGIPYLLPTQIMRKSSLKALGPIQEEIRVNLANIKTEVIESYIDDLKNMPLSTESNLLLGISTPSDLERYGALTIFITISSLLAFCIFGLPQTKIGWLLLGSFSVFELIIWFLNILFGSEHYRRNTFIWYINIELLRRRGISPGQTTSAIKVD